MISSHSIIPKKYKKTNRAARKYSANSFNNFIYKIFKNVDIYGNIINLNYKRQETFNTCPSAFISLITIFITATSLSPRLEDFIYNKNV